MATYKYLNPDGFLGFIEADSSRDAAKKLTDSEIQFIPGSIVEVDKRTREDGQRNER